MSNLLDSCEDITSVLVASGLRTSLICIPNLKCFKNYNFGHPSIIFFEFLTVFFQNWYHILFFPNILKFTLIDATFNIVKSTLEIAAPRICIIRVEIPPQPWVLVAMENFNTLMMFLLYKLSKVRKFTVCYVIYYGCIKAWIAH